MIDLEEIGLLIDRRGNLEEINYNAFCRYLLGKEPLVFSPNINKFYHYNSGVYISLDHTTISALIRAEINALLPDCWKPVFERNFLQTLRLEAKHVKEFNKNTTKLNLQNGIFDLKIFELKPHSTDFFSTIQLPIVYDKEAKCPRFKKFLMEIFAGDKERIHLIKQIFGYCLTSSTKCQKAFLLKGSGANGKSVLLNVLTELVGTENIANLPLSALKDSFRIASLVDKNVNIVAEGGFKTNTFSTEIFKAIVAGDLCFGEIKHGPTFSFKPKCKIIISVNKLPHISDTSYGMERRLIIIPFDRIFRAEEQNKSLSKILLKELPGILNFALDGLRELRQNKYNFVSPKACQKAEKEFFQYNNPIKEFVETQLYEEPDNKLTYKRLAETYLQWLSLEGMPVPSNFNRRHFSSEIKLALDSLDIPYQIGGKSGDSRRIDGIAIRKQKSM